MLGMNEIAKRNISDGKTLWVNSIFYTIQGEGPFMGCPAVFIRLAGCNLRCWWCDTEFEKGEELSVLEINAQVVAAKAGTPVAFANTVVLIVITGGEPFLQNLAPLCSLLVGIGYTVQIETAGTLWLQDEEDGHKVFIDLLDQGKVQIVVSPKTGKVHKQIGRRAAAWKYIIREGETSDDDGLPMFSAQGRECGEPVKQMLQRPYQANNPDTVVFVQPCDEGNAESNWRNMQETTRVAMKYGYRLSLQMHKIVGLD